MSVILTVYKRINYLEIALQSVVAQTLLEWECIVSDDANSAVTREICGRFAYDSRIRYRQNETTVGAPSNVAAALREARGKYVAILNDDDVLYPRMLEKLVAVLDANPKEIAAFGNHEVIDENGLALKRETEAELHVHRRMGLKPGLIPNSFDFALRGGLMVVMGCVFRRPALDPALLLKEVGSAYDYWASIILGEHGDFIYLPEQVMAWRSHPNSVSSQVSSEVYASEIYIYESLAHRKLSPPLHDYVESQLAGCLLMRGLAYLERGWNVTDARSFLYRSLRIKWRFVSFRYWLSTFLPVEVRRLSTHLWRSTMLKLSGKPR